MHAVMFCCLKVVNLFKRLCQIVNRNNVWLWDFTYILRNLVLDLPSVVLNGDNVFVLFAIPWHQWSQSFKTASPIKSNTLNISSRTVSKIQKYSKKYWNWLLAANHFRKNVSPQLLNRVVKMSLSLVITLSWRYLYHIEISPLICRANQWTGFYMIGTSVMKELRKNLNFFL